MSRKAYSVQASKKIKAKHDWIQLFWNSIIAVFLIDKKNQNLDAAVNEINWIITKSKCITKKSTINKSEYLQQKIYRPI